MANPAAEPTLLSDEELVSRIVAGEKHLFDTIVQRHHRRLLRVGISILHNETEAEDVVQDAFLSAYQHLAQFAGRAKFSTWLSRIAMHRAFALATQNGRHVSLDEEYEDDQPMRVVPDPAPTPEQALYFREVASLVGAAVAQLPESYRSVLLMRQAEESDTSVTARNLRISQSNVKVRLHRARAMVRVHLDRALASGILPAESFDQLTAAVV
ncbi:MAG: sigma-70 family RNA polymerase sigma factor [Terriglobales bacterium]